MPGLTTCRAKAKATCVPFREITATWNGPSSVAPETCFACGRHMRSHDGKGPAEPAGPDVFEKTGE